MSPKKNSNAAITEEVFIPLNGGGEAVTYLKYGTDLNAGDKVVGLYLRKTAPAGEYDSFGYRIKADDGTIFHLNSAGQLNYWMDQVKPGTRVEITYKGKEKAKKGPRAGKMVHSFIVATSSAANLAPLRAAASVDDDDADTSDESEEDSF